jgi:hypothetical protein
MRSKCPAHLPNNSLRAEEYYRLWRIALSPSWLLIQKHKYGTTAESKYRLLGCIRFRARNIPNPQPPTRTCAPCIKSQKLSEAHGTGSGKQSWTNIPENYVVLFTEPTVIFNWRTAMINVQLRDSVVRPPQFKINSPLHVRRPLNSQRFTVPGRSLPCSQEPATPPSWVHLLL